MQLIEKLGLHNLAMSIPTENMLAPVFGLDMLPLACVGKKAGAPKDLQKLELLHLKSFPSDQQQMH